MPSLISHHSFVAIFLIVLLEEGGIPLPIPSDLLILVAGAMSAHSLPQLALWFVLLVLASSIGSSGFYAVIRRGGRPLVERFGHYVHLGPKELAWAESLLQRSGWSGIALGRAIPGVRHVVIVACGVLGISYQRYITAQLIGSSVYMGVLLGLGARFGPSIIEGVHIPRLAVRLLGSVVLAVGLPGLLAWFSFRAHIRPQAEPSRRQIFWATVLASFIGTIALSAAWAAAATLAEFHDVSRTLSITFALAQWLMGQGLRPGTAYVLAFMWILLLCVGLGVLYYTVIMPKLAPNGTTITRQTLGLAVLTCGLLGLILAPALLAGSASPIGRWWKSGGLWLALTLAWGILDYAITTVLGHNLAVAMFRSRQVDASNQGAANNAPIVGKVGTAE